ncbi:hypothetical protein [Anaeromicrobium sediminis]|uniref:Uncharacterized protein n=1 Tax=Anaeromicrobium sediminis TaxID=1478221 RepID=A0A267MLA2_9FIRM|nr:hypothetical protein [Anaeromicrobium sediminis]PAB60316.1 hypothetical protein CCE28_05315 [Anaeromicrobium sediminis]
MENNIFVFTMSRFNHIDFNRKHIDVDDIKEIKKEYKNYEKSMYYNDVTNILEDIENAILNFKGEKRYYEINKLCGNAKQMVKYQINCKIDNFSKKIQQTNISDYYIYKIDSENLHIVGSFDLSYYYEVEIVLHGVEFISCPTYTSFDFIKIIGTNDNIKELPDFIKNNEDKSIIFFMEDEFSQCKNFIVASDISFKWGLKHWNK